MVYISFPGDEKGSGGCVAAGRGFFHINSHGGAEPCPFSPYSDVNIRNTSLREAVRSPLFLALQNEDILKDDHDGGCVLYEKRELVEQLMRRHDASGPSQPLQTSHQPVASDASSSSSGVSFTEVYSFPAAG